MTLNEMIKEIMDTYDLSVPQFAKKTGLSPTTVRALLTPNWNPHYNTLFAIINAFNIPPAFFFDRELTADTFRLLIVYFSSAPEEQDLIRKTIKSLANESNLKS